jgi:hypothetical protein
MLAGPGQGSVCNGLFSLRAIATYIFTAVFLASASYVYAQLDSDGDGIADNLDPYPDDASNNSSERQSIVWQVAEIYLATLGRAMDYEGLFYWADRVATDSNWTPETVAQSFFDQPEVQSLYPSSASTGAFVNALYNNILGRPADIEGFNYWVAELDSGRLRRDQMVIALINGAWGNPEAFRNGDVARFRNRTLVAGAFANYQSVNNIVFSQLSASQRQDFLSAATSVLSGVTSDIQTATESVNRIQSLLIDLEAIQAFLVTLTSLYDFDVGTFRLTEVHDFVNSPLDGGSILPSRPMIAVKDEVIYLLDQDVLHKKRLGEQNFIRVGRIGFEGCADLFFRGGDLLCLIANQDSTAIDLWRINLETGFATSIAGSLVEFPTTRRINTRSHYSRTFDSIFAVSLSTIPTGAAFLFEWNIDSGLIKRTTQLSGDVVVCCSTPFVGVVGNFLYFEGSGRTLGRIDVRTGVVETRLGIVDSSQPIEDLTD